jgi:hypothetical protein
MNIFIQIIYLIKIYRLYGNIFLNHFENIKNIDYSKLNGRWNEYITSKFENLDKFKKNIINYDYTYIVNENNIFDKIIYKKIDKDNHNNIIIETGKIYYKNDKLKIYNENTSIYNNYAIIKTGEFINNSYKYLIITESNDSKLYVLVRDIDNIDIKYKNEIKDYLEYYNFNYIVKNETYNI